MTAIPYRLAALLSERSKTRALVAQLQSAASKVRGYAPNTARDYHARAAYFEGMISRLDSQISSLGEG